MILTDFSTALMRLHLNNTVQTVLGGVATGWEQHPMLGQCRDRMGATPNAWAVSRPDGATPKTAQCGDSIDSLPAPRRDATMKLFGKNQSYITKERFLYHSLLFISACKTTTFSLHLFHNKGYPSNKHLFQPLSSHLCPSPVLLSVSRAGPFRCGLRPSARLSTPPPRSL